MKTWPAPRPHEHKILIVDDDADTRQAMKSLIESRGWRTQTAANGFVALRQIEGPNVPCLVIADVRMPVMDGYSLVHELRSRPRLQHVPLLLMTGADGVLERKGISVLKKPFSVDALVEKLRHIDHYCPHINPF